MITAVMIARSVATETTAKIRLMGAGKQCGYN